jgi:hypothetical protein
MRFALSCSLSKPAKAILSPGTYLAGFLRNMNRCLSVQVIPLFFMLLLYLKPVAPAGRPTSPARIGAEAVFSSPSKAWHAEQCWSNTSRPCPASPLGTSTSGSVIPFFLGGITLRFLIFIISNFTVN